MLRSYNVHNNYKKLFENFSNHDLFISIASLLDFQEVKWFMLKNMYILF